MASVSFNSTAKRDRAATPSTLRPVLSNLPDQGRCHGPDRFPVPMLSGRHSLRPNWTRVLPAKVDGRASYFLHPSSSSGVSLSAVPKNSTREFQNAGKCFQKTGK